MHSNSEVRGSCVVDSTLESTKPVETLVYSCLFSSCVPQPVRNLFWLQEPLESTCGNDEVCHSSPPFSLNLSFSTTLKCISFTPIPGLPIFDPLLDSEFYMHQCLKQTIQHQHSHQKRNCYHLHRQGAPSSTITEQHGVVIFQTWEVSVSRSRRRINMRTEDGSVCRPPSPLTSLDVSVPPGLPVLVGTNHYKDLFCHLSLSCLQTRWSNSGRALCHEYARRRSSTTTGK